MDHNDIRHKLSEYLDDAVTAEERAAIDRHIVTCEACRTALNELQKTIEAMKQVEEIEPPAWMAQKIMAKVREEQSARKSIWQRIFVPLSVKLPVQAVAVLFLTITAYYIYVGIHPAEKYAEAPAPMIAKQEAPAPSTGEARLRRQDGAPAPEEKIAQQPAYKALDMKDAYEQPAPPVPAAPPAGNVAASAPAPAKAKTAGEAAHTREETDAARSAPAAGAPAPALLAEQTTQQAGASAGATVRRDERALKKAERSAAADKDADDTLDVTEHFVRTDLPPQLKSPGLRFHTIRVQDNDPDLPWLRTMPSYRASSCAGRYLVHVEAQGTSLRYLYCKDGAGIRLIGTYRRSDGAWSEQK